MAGAVLLQPLPGRGELAWLARPGGALRRPHPSLPHLLFCCWLLPQEDTRFKRKVLTNYGGDAALAISMGDAKTELMARTEAAKILPSFCPRRDERWEWVQRVDQHESGRGAFSAIIAQLRLEFPDMQSGITWTWWNKARQQHNKATGKGPKGKGAL